MLAPPKLFQYRNHTIRVSAFPPRRRQRRGGLPGLRLGGWPGLRGRRPRRRAAPWPMMMRCLAWTVVLWRGGVLASVEDCRLAIDAGGEALDVDLNARELHLSEAITMAAAVVARMPDGTLHQPCRGADGTSNDAGAACVVRTIVDALRARRRECGLSDIFEGDDSAAPERDAGPTRKVAVVVLRGDTFRQGATAECARLEYKACSASCDGGDRTRLVQLSAVQSVQDFLVAPLRAAGWAVHLLAYAHACGLNGVLKDALAERVDAASFDFVEVAAPTSEATAKKTQAEMAAAALRRAFSSGGAADVVVLTRFDLEFARPLLDDLSGTVWGRVWNERGRCASTSCSRGRRRTISRRSTRCTSSGGGTGAPWRASSPRSIRSRGRRTAARSIRCSTPRRSSPAIRASRLTTSGATRPCSASPRVRANAPPTPSRPSLSVTSPPMRRSGPISATSRGCGDGSTGRRPSYRATVVNSSVLFQSLLVRMTWH